MFHTRYSWPQQSPHFWLFLSNFRYRWVHIKHCMNSNQVNQHYTIHYFPLTPVVSLYAEVWVTINSLDAKHTQPQTAV